MTDYLLIALHSHPDESESDFQARLARFWTHYLRNRPDDYEKVYAEKTASSRDGNLLKRSYLVEADGIAPLTQALAELGIDHDPVDPDDVYSKYEAAPPEWFWIEH